MDIEIFQDIIDDTVVYTVWFAGEEIVKSSDNRVRQYIESGRIEELVSLLIDSGGELDVLE